MKEMILFILSTLLIAGMAGSALAAGGSFDFVDVTNHNHSYVNDGGIIMSSNRMDIDLKCIPGASTYDTANLTITRTDSSEESHLSVDPKSVEFKNLEKGIFQYQTISLIASGASDGETYELEVNGAPQIKTVVTVDVTYIPEFPTVTLPVVAILGLIFVFGRKKEVL